MKDRALGVRKRQTNTAAIDDKSDVAPRQIVAESERGESELRRLSRALRTLSHCNHAVVRAQSEQELLESVCRSMVNAGGYRMAWVGVGNQDPNKTISPLAHAGFEDGYLHGSKITWADANHGRGPTGTAIRTGKTAIARNIQVDPSMLAWRDEALKRGYASSIALPILLDGRVFGAFTIYAEEPDAFDSAEVQLLTELTEDLAYGIQALRTRAERAGAEEALRNNEAKFRAVIENSRDGILFADAENKIIYRSPSYQLINGFTDEERLGHVGYETVHPDDVEALRRAWSHIVEHPGKTCEIADYRIRHKDGTWKWVESSAVNLLANPHVGAIVVTTRDLTERRRAEEALRESEAAFRTLAEAVPQLVWMCTPDGMNFYFNQRWVDYTGLTLEQSYGKGWNTPFHPDDKQAAWDAWSHATKTGRKYQVESRLRAADGSYRWFLMRGEPLLDSAGSIAKWFGTCTDIDELKLTAEALQREKAFTEAVIDSFPDVFFVIQETGKFLHWGRNPEKVLGYTNKETMAMESALEIVAEDDRPRAARAIEEAFAQGSTAVELHLLHRDGGKIPYLVRATRAIIGQAAYMVGLGLDITERKRAEEALRDSAVRFRTTFDTAGIGIALVDMQGRPMQSNPALEKIMGYTAAELSGMAFTDFTHPHDRELDQALYFELMDGRRDNYEIEKRYVRKDGQLVWGLLTVSLVRDSHGQPQYAVGMVQDVTARKHAEEALRQNEAALKEALSAAQMGVWNQTIETGTTSWDENLYRLAGRDPKLPSPSFHELQQIYTPASWERLKPAVENALSTATPYELDLEMLRPDGSKRCWISRGAAVRDASGRIIRLRGTVQDVTERIRADQSVRESEEKFRKAFMTGAAAFYIATLNEGKLIEANARFYEMFGYSWEEMAGKSSLELGLYLDPQDRQKLVAEITSKGLVREVELGGRKKDGTLITVLLSVSLLQGGNEPLILGAVTNITERKKAEAALRESAARLKNSEKLAHLGSSTWDVATDTTTWSDELYRIVGRDPNLPPPKHAERAAIYTPESWERLDIAVRQALATGAPYDLELDVFRPDGSQRHVHARGVAERAPDGNVVRLQGTLQDITDHHRLEQQFRQAQKMEAVGRLAGGVAHDFNNLLTVINGYSEMALETLGPKDPKRTHFSEIRKAGERAAGLTRQLLAFSRQQVLAPRVLDLNAVISDMEKMLRRLIGEDINLAVVQGPALGQVKADPGQIEQIIMNLAVNARDAMPHGGKLVITTTNTKLEKHDFENIPSAFPGNYVMVAVTDTGTGMDAETQSHIFEPFFTTKDPGKGTGLGLATVYGIVKQSSGYIWVYSALGQGTTFKIYLPRVDEPNEPFLPTEADAHPVGGSETILLVEDEKELSALAVRVLQARGYKVLESASPEDALQMSAQHDGPIHLLLTDVVMPGISGRTVAERLAPLRPNTKVLYMSGYTDDTVFRNGVLETGAAFIQKPFTPSSLARKVREVLDEHKPV